MNRNIDTKGHRRRRRVAFIGLAAAGIGWAASTAHAAPSTERVNVNSGGQQANDHSGSPAVSSDGSVIAFSSVATNLAGGQTTGQVYVRDKPSGRTEIASMASVFPNGRALSPSISETGRFVTFQSRASNLVTGDTNNADDIFVKDRATGSVTRVSVSRSGVQGNGGSSDPMISADGRVVVYHSDASNLVAGDTNGVGDIFVHDRTTRVTTASGVGTTGVQGNLVSRNPSVSRDGNRIAFESAATNLVTGDTNGFTDVFVANRTGVTIRVSQSSQRAQGNSSSRNGVVSGDGRAVAFDSGATNLVSGDTNSRSDVFHHDLITRLTTRVVNGRNSRDFNDPGNGHSTSPSISHNGRIVAFRSEATNLTFDDRNGAVADIYVANLDRPLGSQNRLASVSSAGASANGASAAASLNTGGTIVGFTSFATNLVSGDTNARVDVFARTLQ